MRFSINTNEAIKITNQPKATVNLSGLIFAEKSEPIIDPIEAPRIESMIIRKSN